MNFIAKITYLIIPFAFFSIYAYTIKRRGEKVKLAEKLKLEKEAQKYFVTICHNLLTPFGDEDGCERYLTFSIIGDHLFVFEVDKKNKAKHEYIVSAKFNGETIVDQLTYFVHSYSSFEQYLCRVVGDSLVYCYHLKHLWKKLNESTIQ